MNLGVDEILALKKAAHPQGFAPYGRPAIHIAYSLEAKGWLRKSPRKDVWYVTEAGRDVLASQMRC